MLSDHSCSVRLAAGFLALSLAACSSGLEQGDTEGPITAATVLIDGSSTVLPITLEAARRFERRQKQADIRVTGSGTTAGLRRFCAGAIDVADASRMIDENERALCAGNDIAFLELPLATDTLAVVVHFDNDWVDHLTLDELKRIWEPAAEGTVMRWNQIRPEWPDESLVLFGRGQNSGTYDHFTTEITGELRASRRDYTASEDEEFLAAGIASEPNSLGFFGIGAYHRHWETLRVVPIDAGRAPVYPSLESAKDGSYRPLSRQMYLYVNKRALLTKPHLPSFLDDYFAGIDRWLHLTGYLPLHEDIYAVNRYRVRQVTDQRTTLRADFPPDPSG